MKTTVSPEFQPTPETIKSLLVWGEGVQRLKLYGKWFEPQHWLQGERRLDEKYITAKYNITKFVCFWSDEEQSGNYDRKKSNWQRAYQTEIKKSWGIACLEYDKANRHRRPDNGSGGFKSISEAYAPDKPVPEPVRRYRIPTDEESRENFKRLEEEILNEEIN